MFKKLRLATLIGAALVTSGLGVAAERDALPAAKPGECYAKVVTPARFETRQEELVLSEASERIEVVPANYEWAEERVVVKEASEQLIPVPAEYETVTERVETRPSSRSWTLTAGGKTREANASVVAYAKGVGLPEGSAQPGDCFAEYYTPAQFRTEKQQVVKKEASETVEIVPARYEVVDEQILVKEASTQVIKVPAEYDTVTEQVMVSPATTMWKQGRGLVERIDNTTGEIVCLVEVPAQYKTVSKRIVKTPESTRVVEIPAEYKTQKVRKLVEPAREVRKDIPAEMGEITRTTKVGEETVGWYPKGAGPADGRTTGNELCLREVPAVFETVTRRITKTAAGTKRVEIPAEYSTVKVKKLVSPATEKTIEIPAKFQTVSKRVQVEDERIEWRRVLCETNMTAGIMRNVQTALRDAGFYKGPIDGIYGGLTKQAVDQYQAKNGLARGGLTMDTLDALKVSL
ncbi:MAG: peptidoglycan-binding protein [Thiotrichales bacterium]